MPKKSEREAMKEEISSLTQLPHEILASALKAGMEERGKHRAGSFVHLDHSTVFSKVNERFKGKLEIMDVKKALEKYSWVKDYWWRMIGREKDAFTKKVARDYSGGYFLRIMNGAKVKFPLQSCLLMTPKVKEQRVHNIIIAEEGSEASIITGCAAHPEVGATRHVGVSEFFVKKNAFLNFTMIHHWGENTEVIPRSAALVEEGATFISNYLCANPVKKVQMYPSAECLENATARFNSLLHGSKKSVLDVGSKIMLSGKGSRGEVISRAIATDASKIIVRGMLGGKAEKSKAHLECRGLMLSDESVVHAIPELRGEKQDVQLSHEAAVGKIEEAKITYLMSRGLSEDQATSTIVRGFMSTEIMGLPKKLKLEVDAIMQRTLGGM